MPSIKDVAKEAGVSTATVSRTFTTPSLINEHTHKRVMEAARQLNYQPGRLRAPRGQSRQTSKTRDAIGFQFFAAEPGDTLQSNMFYAPVLSGAQNEADKQGLHLLLHTTDRRRFVE